MSGFAVKVIEFNKKLSFAGNLPDGIRIMNPFKENPEILTVSEKFYKMFYSDAKKRNPYV